MSKQYFMPRADLEKQTWLNNFSAKLYVYKDKYNVSEEDVADMKASAAFFNYWMDYRNQFNEYLSKLTEYKNELINGIAAGATVSLLPSVPVLPAPPSAVDPGIFKRATAIANGIKVSSKYTIADGNDLGLEGATITTNREEMKPVLKLRLIAGGKPEILWTKQKMDGIEIYVDRATAKWELLAFDTYPNYTDMAPLPAAGTSAVWQYKAIYRYGDVQVGLWSDAVSITVTGI